MPMIQPFARPETNYTMMHNFLYDEVMPHLRPNAWKVLCYIARRTLGWNKFEEEISYASIQKGTGIGSTATLSAAISELEEAGYVLCVKRPGYTNAYALNQTFTIEYTAPITCTSLETEEGTSLETEEVTWYTPLETEEGTSLETEDIKRKNNTKEKRESAQSVPPTDIPLPEDACAATQTLTLPLVGLNVEEVQTDAPKKEDAPKPKDHPAVVKYRELNKRWPNNAQMQVILDAGIDDIDLWEEAVKAWCGRGFSPVNINGMIEYYRDPSKFRTPYEQKVQHRTPVGVVNPSRPIGIGFGKVEYKR